MQTGFYIEPGQYHMDGTPRWRMRGHGSASATTTSPALPASKSCSRLWSRDVTAADLLLNLPVLLSLVSDTVASDIPLEHMPYLAQMLEEADLSGADRLVIQHPLAYTDYLTDGTYVLVPDIPAIQAAVADMLTPHRRGRLPGPRTDAGVLDAGHQGRRNGCGGRPVPLTVPIYQTSTFEVGSATELEELLEFRRPGHSYTRYSNPTHAALEGALAELEGGRRGWPPHREWPPSTGQSCPSSVPATR